MDHRSGSSSIRRSSSRSSRSIRRIFRSRCNRQQSLVNHADIGSSTVTVTARPLGMARQSGGGLFRPLCSARSTAALLSFVFSVLSLSFPFILAGVHGGWVVSVSVPSPAPAPLFLAPPFSSSGCCLHLYLTRPSQSPGPTIAVPTFIRSRIQIQQGLLERRMVDHTHQQQQEQQHDHPYTYNAGLFGGERNNNDPVVSDALRPLLLQRLADQGWNIHETQLSKIHVLYKWNAAAQRLQLVDFTHPPPPPLSPTPPPFARPEPSRYLHPPPYPPSPPYPPPPPPLWINVDTRLIPSTNRTEQIQSKHELLQQSDSLPPPPLCTPPIVPIEPPINVDVSLQQDSRYYRPKWGQPSDSGRHNPNHNSPTLPFSSLPPPPPAVSNQRQKRSPSWSWFEREREQEVKESMSSPSRRHIPAHHQQQQLQAPPPPPPPPPLRRSALGYSLEPMTLEQVVARAKTLQRDQSVHVLLMGGSDPIQLPCITHNGIHITQQRISTHTIAKEGIFVCCISDLPVFAASDLSSERTFQEEILPRSSGDRGGDRSGGRFLIFKRPIAPDHVLLVAQEEDNNKNDDREQEEPPQEEENSNSRKNGSSLNHRIHNNRVIARDAMEVLCAKSKCHLGYYTAQEGFCISASALDLRATTTMTTAKSSTSTSAVDSISPPAPSSPLPFTLPADYFHNTYNYDEQQQQQHSLQLQSQSSLLDLDSNHSVTITTVQNNDFNKYENGKEEEYDNSNSFNYSPMWGKGGEASYRTVMKEEESRHQNHKMRRRSALGYSLTPLTFEEVIFNAKSLLNNDLTLAVLLQGQTEPHGHKITHNGVHVAESHNTNPLPDGVFVCALSNLPLFTSADLDVDATADSGWLLFRRPISTDHVLLVERDRGGVLLEQPHMEVLDAKSKCHLGHYYGKEGYCINACTLNFVPITSMEEEEGGGGGTTTITTVDPSLHASLEPYHQSLETKRTTVDDPSSSEVTSTNSKTTTTKTIVLGAGSFWDVEHALRRLLGVLHTEMGYAGGSTPHPTYAEVCRGESGHAETVRVEFDPEVLEPQVLVQCFMAMHNPLKSHAVGKWQLDTGPQRSCIVMAANRSDAQFVIQVRTALEAYQAQIGQEISTSLYEMDASTGKQWFWPAEVHLQQNFQNRSDNGEDLSSHASPLAHVKFSRSNSSSSDPLTVQEWMDQFAQKST